LFSSGRLLSSGDKNLHINIMGTKKEVRSCSLPFVVQYSIHREEEEVACRSKKRA